MVWNIITQYGTFAELDLWEVVMQSHRYKYILEFFNAWVAWITSESRISGMHGLGDMQTLQTGTQINKKQQWVQCMYRHLHWCMHRVGPVHRHAPMHAQIGSSVCIDMCMDACTEWVQCMYRYMHGCMHWVRQSYYIKHMCIVSHTHAARAHKHTHTHTHTQTVHTQLAKGADLRAMPLTSHNIQMTMKDFQNLVWHRHQLYT